MFNVHTFVTFSAHVSLAICLMSINLRFVEIILILVKYHNSLVCRI